MKVGTWQQPTPKGALLGPERSNCRLYANIRAENVNILLRQT